MEKEECHRLVDAYVQWLREGLDVQPINGSCELTTPFLDRHNDHLQIYATKRDDQIILSDDGYILSELRTSGVDLNTPRRREIVQDILNGFGVKSDSRQLTAEASAKTLGQKVHSLLQAMLAINDLYVMAQPRVASFFLEDVQHFLDEKRIRYSPRVKITGKSGFDQAIDFLIPKSLLLPERFIKAIPDPKKETVALYLFSLQDTRAARTDGESEAYAFLDNRAHKISMEVVEALKSYDVHSVPWTEREQHVKELLD